MNAFELSVFSIVRGWAVGLHLLLFIRQHGTCFKLIERGGIVLLVP